MLATTFVVKHMPEALKALTCGIATKGMQNARQYFTWNSSDLSQEPGPVWVVLGGVG